MFIAFCTFMQLFVDVYCESCFTKEWEQWHDCLGLSYFSGIKMKLSNFNYERTIFSNHLCFQLADLWVSREVNNYNDYWMIDNSVYNIFASNNLSTQEKSLFGFFSQKKSYFTGLTITFWVHVHCIQMFNWVSQLYLLKTFYYIFTHRTF